MFGRGGFKEREKGPFSPHSHTCDPNLVEVDMMSNQSGRVLLLEESGPVYLSLRDFATGVIKDWRKLKFQLIIRGRQKGLQLVIMEEG